MIERDNRKKNPHVSKNFHCVQSILGFRPNVTIVTFRPRSLRKIKFKLKLLVMVSLWYLNNDYHILKHYHILQITEKF